MDVFLNSESSCRIDSPKYNAPLPSVENLDDVDVARQNTTVPPHYGGSYL